MRDVNGRTLHTRSRVQGRPHLVRRLQGLLLSAHRFGRHRATTAHDRNFAARLIGGLEGVLHDCEGERQTAPKAPALADALDSAKVGA